MGSAVHRRSRRGIRASTIALVLLVVTLGLVVTGRTVVGSTYSILNAETVNSGSTFADGSLGVPTNLQAVPTGANIDLSWGAGSNGNQYDVLSYDAGATASCPSPGSSSYSILTPPATTTSFTDTPSTSTYGDHYCYEVENAFGTSWTSVNDGSGTTNTNPIASVQAGFVASAITIANGGNTTGCAANTFGTAGRLDCGDQIVVTFNQQPTVTTVAGVCVTTTSSAFELDLGVTSCGATPTLGKLVASSGSVTNSGIYYPATATLSATAPWTLTITVGASSTGTYTSFSTGSGTPSWTLQPLSTLTPVAGSPAICTTASTCEPIGTSAF